MSHEKYRFEGPATTLADAFEAFGWRDSRDPPGGALERWYQKRSGYRNLTLLHEHLDMAVARGRFLHALYMGPAGCGKSTDLTWLGHRIAEERALDDELLIVHYAIADAVGTHDVAFAELVFSMVLELYAELERLNLSFHDASYLETLENWLFGEESRNRKEESNKDVSMGGKIVALKGQLSSRVLRQQEVKTRVRHFQPQIHHEIGKLFGEVQEKTGKQILFIVDDLEKITPLTNGLNVFLNHSGFFGDLPCHSIFTAPGALRLEAHYQDVLRHFRECRAILGRPRAADGEELEEFEILRKIVHRRMVPELAARAAVDEAIGQTGGLLSHLIDVMGEAILQAKVDKVERVEPEHVRRALKELSIRFNSMLVNEDYKVLDRLQRSGLRSEVGRPELLHNLSVLEYPDSPSVFALHPLVEPLLARWREHHPPESGEEDP